MPPFLVGLRDLRVSPLVETDYLAGVRQDRGVDRRDNLRQSVPPQVSRGVAEPNAAADPAS